MTSLSPDAEGLLRTLTPQVLGALVRRHGQFDSCEDAVQEALLAAAVQWPEQGMPDNPRAWLLTVATRRLTDGWRSESARRAREVAAVRDAPTATAAPADEPQAADDTLTLLFLCCHPALPPASQVALTLRAVGGLSTAQIARAFLVPEATMSQRIRRAKQRVAETGVRFAMPSAGEREERLRAVLQVLYLIFNEGYTASSGPNLQRGELTAEAIRLTRGLHKALPDDGEVTGLLALMLLNDSHRAARTGPHGELIPLAEQDRARWDRAAIAEGVALVTSALASSPPGPYQLQAAIAAVHAEAPRAEDTDWRQIVALYRLLSHVAPSPMVALNEAGAVAMVHGPRGGLDRLELLDGDERLAGHHRLAAVRGHLLEMAGEREAARTAYRQAARLTTSLPEQRYLETRAARLAPDPTRPDQTGVDTMDDPRTATVEAPGATLHYDVQGSGPVLLLICGGVYGATGFAELARHLAAHYTVVTYDRRGNSRSRLNGPPAAQRIEVHSDDARRVLAAVGVTERAPAYVFGNSSGATIGLDLAARHPELVHALVAHEPPVMELLADRELWRTVAKQVEEAFATAGAGAAMQVFGAAFAPEAAEGSGDGSGDGSGGDAAAPEMPEAMLRNMEFFIGYEVPTFMRYHPDVAALRTGRSRIVAAVGEASAGEPAHRAGAAVAEQLGTQPVVFPGDHGGFGAHAAAFAVTLHSVLSDPTEEVRDE